MRIAVLTSGGDSAGMNAVVRAVVRAGIVKYVNRYRTSRSNYYVTEGAKRLLSVRDMKDLCGEIPHPTVQVYPLRTRLRCQVTYPTKMSSIIFDLGSVPF